MTTCFTRFALLLLLLAPTEVVRGEFLAGAAVVDVTPLQLPVLVNGGMLTRSADAIKTRVKARAVVLSDGETQIGLVVVDSCMIPKLLLDDAKHRAAARTELEADRIMISATHTHTAPSSFGALGTAADMSYVPFLREQLVEALVQAEANLQPAEVGWGSGSAEAFTALRRWVRRPDRVETDPFGNPTVRANMHAARVPDDVTGPTGPEDPELSMIAIRATDGTPIAVLCNFSMHYFGDQPISADYFGLFCDGLERYVAGDRGAGSEVVAIMSHGCSGDIWRRDYFNHGEQNESSLEGYTQGLLEVAKPIYDSIHYQSIDSLAMAEARLPMKYRLPDLQRLEWAKRIVDQMGDRPPKDKTEVYAREQVLLHELKETTVVLQAIRIGDKIGIATTPNETYALTGLKLKLQSPLEQTMVIELANGADGYIPPPEQHHLGGYNTWAARSAGLEVQAEPRIVAQSLQLLEQVSASPRRSYQPDPGPAVTAILELKPTVYWRMHEMQRPLAVDHSGNQHHGAYELGTLFFLDGPERYASVDDPNRCVHFAGGRLVSQLEQLGESYSVVMSFWNGMPSDARATAGWLFSRDHPHGTSQWGEHLGLGGTATEPGKLVLIAPGLTEPAVGRTPVERWSWNQLVLVRQADRVQVYLNGQPDPEIDVVVATDPAVSIASCFIGGRSDNDGNWEGRIDEVAIFARPLSGDEIARIAN